MITLATLNDIPLLLELAKEHIAESDWDYHYNEQKARASFYKYIMCNETDVLLYEDKGHAIVAWDDEFHDERLGYILKFYISHSARGKGASRELMKACNEWFDHYGCEETIVTDDFGKNGSKIFKNLAAKYNYHPNGEVLIRRVK